MPVSTVIVKPRIYFLLLFHKQKHLAHLNPFLLVSRKRPFKVFIIHKNSIYFTNLTVAVFNIKCPTKQTPVCQFKFQTS